MLRLLPGGPRIPVPILFASFITFSSTVFVAAPLRAQAPPATTVTVDDRGTIARPGPSFHPSRVLVHFQPGRAADVLPGSPSLRRFPLDRDLYLVENPPGLTVADVLGRYRANPNVLYVEPDYVVNAVDVAPNDPRWPEQWDMAKIAAPAAWNTQTDASDVIVAVIDTGVDFGHPDLQANIWTNPNDGAHGYTCMNGPCVIGGVDDHGHGTHVAGTIGASGNNGVGIAGINWSARLVSLKFLGSGGSGSTSDAVLAFDKITELRQQGFNIRVSSNSWGGGGFSQALKDAMARAESAGVVHVCAAGNSNANADASPMYPAAYDNRGIISVLATDANDLGAGFSNYGLASVDIAAPGVNTLSTVPTITCSLCDPSGYKPLSGTSMATPHVSGVLAALFHQTPGLSTSQARDLVLDPLSYDALTDTKAAASSTGGRLNFAKALTAPHRLNAFPTLSMGPDVFASAGSQVDLSASASDDDGDSLRMAWVKSTGSGSTWLFGSMLNTLFPNPSGSGVSFAAPLLARTALAAYDASVADGRGGSDHGRDYVTVSPVSNPGGPPAGTLTVSPTDAPAGTTITVNFPATDPEGGGVRWDLWIGQNSGASGTCCLTGTSTTARLDNAGVYRFSTQAIDGELNLSARQSAVVRIGGATGEPPLASATVDKMSGQVPLTVNIDMSGSTDADGTISNYFFNCGGGTFTPVAASRGSCTYNTPGTYWIMLQVSDNSRNNDLMSLYAVATPVSGPPPPDNELPVATITSPAAGSHVSGNVTIAASASDNVGVTRVDFYLDNPNGTPIGSDATAPYSITWDASSTPAGSHTLYASARDAAGNVGTSSGTPITVGSAPLPPEPPRVTMTNPANGEIVNRRSTVPIIASATPGSQPITRVDFLVGSSVLCPNAQPDTDGKYQCSWVVPAAANKTYQLRANAYDTAGRVGTASVTVATK